MKLNTKADLAMGAFLCACLIPSLGMLILPEEPAAANQPLAQPPSLTTQDGSLNVQVLDEVTDYVQDHFALRQRLITANAALESAVFQTSAQDSVLLGREGWLFYRETVEDYLRTDPLTDRELFCAARTLALLTEYAQTRGASLTFTAAPNKASLYPQYLPYVGTPLEGADDIDRLIPLLEAQGVAYADLFAPFRREDQVLYHATDSHWTNWGAALAHDTLMGSLGGSDWSPWFTQSWHTENTHRGDLYEMLYPTGEMLEGEVVFSREFTFRHVRPIRSPEDQHIETENPGKAGNLLMFRDSFGNTLYSFMAEDFGHAVFSRSMPYQMALLEESGVDTVVIELVERNLNYLVESAPIFPAPERLLSGQPPQGAAAASITAADDGRLAGCIRLEGTLSGPIDVDSPIYIQLGALLYEASPAGTGGEGESPFTLYVPAGSALGDVRALYLLNGQVLEAGRTDFSHN